MIQIGYYLICLIVVGYVVCFCWLVQVYYWYCEGFELFCGVELFVEGDDFLVQVFCVGNVFGVQFYFDVIYVMMYCWIMCGYDGLSVFGVWQWYYYFVDCVVYDVVECVWFDYFIDCWLVCWLVFVQVVE